MRCFLTSAPSRSSTSARSASGASSTSALRGNTAPITEAGSSKARSSRVSRSSRAASSAWIVGGSSSSVRSPTGTQLPLSRRTRPCSMSIETSCRTKSGLPAATSATRSCTPASSVPPSSRSATRLLLVVAGSGSSSIRARSALAHSGLSSSRSCRAAQTTRTALSWTAETRWSTRSRNVVSAQCTSSTITTTGCSAARCSISFRTPQNSSPSENGALERPTAAVDPRCDRVVAADQPTKALGRELRRVLLERSRRPPSPSPGPART